MITFHSAIPPGLVLVPTWYASLAIGWVICRSAMRPVRHGKSGEGNHEDKQ